MEQLKEIYTMKGFGIPEYYVGGNVEYLDKRWTKGQIGIALSAKTYITNVVPKFEKMFQRNLQSFNTPMENDYHPELDDLPILSPLDAS